MADNKDFKCSLRSFALVVALVAIALSSCQPAQANPATRSPCPRAIRINTNTQYRGELHFICLQVQPNSRPRLDVIQYAGQRLIWSDYIDEFDTNQLASFVDDEGTLRILLAVPNKINGTSMYSIGAAGNYISEKHTVNTQFVSTLAIWKLELNWQWHLAIANRPKLDHLVAPDLYANNMRVPLPKPGPMITIHSWRSTYFDRYQIIELPYDGRVNKLEPMHINDQEFLIVAMESNSAHTGQSINSINSLIYKLDFGDGALNWIQYQALNTRLAIDASSFLITHKGSLQMDYYIALVGQQQQHAPARVPDPYSGADYNQQPAEHGLIIYKYFGDQFVKTHSVAVPGATKLDTISHGQGDTYVVVAILSDWSKRISLFLFDGLALKPLPSPQPGLAPRASPRSLPSLKHRRTMDSNSLHLFQVPNQPSNNDSSAKRTLDGTTQNIGGLPALAFSSLSDGDEPSSDSLTTNATAPNAHTDTLYQIPIYEHVDAPDDQDASHTKRNFVNHLADTNGRNLLGWCQAQMNTIIGDKFELAAHQLAALPRVDQARPIEIMGDLMIEGNLHVSNLLYANKIDDGTDRRASFQHPALLNISQTFNQIELTRSQIDSLANRVDQILVDDGTIQEVYTPLRFQRLVFECLNPINMNPRLQPLVGTSSCAQIGELRTNLLNGRNVSDIQRQALLTGRSMVVGQEVRFEHLVLRGQTSILGTLNKLRVDEIVFGRSRKPIGPILGHKNFRNGLYSSANIMVENWNGARVDRQTMLTSTGEQRIETGLRFSQVVLDNVPATAANYSGSSRIERLNGLHLDTHLSQIAQVDDDNKFDVPIAFDELVINGPAYFSPESQLSGVNIESVWASVLFGHSHQNISAPMQFQNVYVSYGGDVHVEGLVNGVALAPGSVMMRNRNYDLPNPFVFESDLSVRLLQLDKALNGIQVILNSEANRYELAILYDGGTQMLTGDKIFNQVQLGGHTKLAGLINGHLNLTQLNQFARNDGQPFRFTNVRLSRGQIRVADNVQLHVSSLVNGIRVNDMCAFANSLMQAPANQQQRRYNRLKFDQLVFKQLRCASINGFNDIRGTFLMKHANQRVLGTLKLVNGVVFNSTVNIGDTFNNLNISPLARAITQVLNESRTGHKDFYGDLFIDDLFAHSINDLHLADVFVAKSDQPQIIRAPMIFDHLDIENVLIVGRELNSNSFNGLNVSDIITNTLQYDSPQVIYNHVELDHLHILPGSNLFTKSLNNYDISQLYSDAVLADVGQQILAPKTFKNFAEFTNRVSFRYGIDGLSENELKFNMLLQSDELIEDDLEFNNDVTIMKSLEIQTGQINDIDVNLFVNSMLYEDRPNGLRVLGNSSLRFKDVKLNDLVVTGTIQGFDLSRDALQKTDNSNGSYDAMIRQQQIMRNSQQMLNRFHNSGATFRLQTRLQNETYLGTCNINSCPQTTPYMTLSPTNPSANQLPMRIVQHNVVNHQTVRPAPPPLSPAPWVMNRPPQPLQPPLPPRPPTPVYNPPIVPMMPRPMALVNTSTIPQVWRPVVRPQAPIHVNDTHHVYEHNFALVDPRYLDYQANLKASAIQNLATRVNRFLSVSFYYEIVQKHPLLGPVLHAAENPIVNEKGNAWLLLKAASKHGEPCLQRGQKIDVMAQQRGRGSTSFTVNSRIQDTSSPSFVESVVVGPNHYLFVTELQPDSNIDTMSHILVYIWNYQNGMYDLRQRIPIDGFPTALKAFVVYNQIACIALANPRVVQSNHSGAPLLYCQHMPMSDFNDRIVLNMNNIFDLDIVSLPSSGEMYIMVAALSQQDTEQVGDLILGRFDFGRRQLVNMVTRRTARPLKLHFIKGPMRNNSAYGLVVSEGITSNDAAQATTRIFSVDPFGVRPVTETQVIRDNQFADIQSVLLDERHPMIFMRSTHSISIYAPMLPVQNAASANPRCALVQFQLVQRLPTKGANKFLVFNTQRAESNRTLLPFDHFLVLSRDDCEHQQYSTLILKPRFK